MTKDEIREDIKRIIKPYENIEITPQLQEILVTQLQFYARLLCRFDPLFENKSTREQFKQRIKEDIKVEITDNGFEISFPVDIFE